MEGVVEPSTFIQEIYFLEFSKFVNSNPDIKRRLQSITTKSGLEEYYMHWLRNVSNLPLVRGCSLGSLIFRFRVHKMLFVRDEQLYWARNGKVNLGTAEKPMWKTIFTPQSRSTTEQDMRANKITWDCAVCGNWCEGRQVSESCCRFCELIAIHKDREAKRKRGISNAEILKQEITPAPITPVKLPEANDYAQSLSLSIPSLFIPSPSEIKHDPIFPVSFLNELKSEPIRTQRSVGDFLASLGEMFRVYQKAFDDYGIDDISDFFELTDDDWTAMNVKPFHRKKILNAL